jgi:hypothetical protein
MLNGISFCTYDIQAEQREVGLGITGKFRLGRVMLRRERLGSVQLG